MESAKLSPRSPFPSATMVSSREDGCAISPRRSRLMRSYSRAADGIVMESKLGHRLGIEQIAPVENDRRRHFFLCDGQIDVGEFGPLRGNNQSLGPFHRFERG